MDHRCTKVKYDGRDACDIKSGVHLRVKLESNSYFREYFSQENTVLKVTIQQHRSIVRERKLSILPSSGNKIIPFWEYARISYSESTHREGNIKMLSRKEWSKVGIFAFVTSDDTLRNPESIPRSRRSLDVEI